MKNRLLLKIVKFLLILFSTKLISYVFKIPVNKMYKKKTSINISIFSILNLAPCKKIINAQTIISIMLALRAKVPII